MRRCAGGMSGGDGEAKTDRLQSAARGKGFGERAHLVQEFRGRDQVPVAEADANLVPIEEHRGVVCKSEVESRSGGSGPRIPRILRRGRPGSEVKPRVAEVGFGGNRVQGKGEPGPGTVNGGVG